MTPTAPITTDTDVEQLTNKIVNFINGIGIPCKIHQLDNQTFLPGIDIRSGSILYDPTLLLYPGDLLHEAGHIAILLPKDRQQAQSPDNLFGDISKEGAETTAIAWSWAALQYLQLAPEIVFHKDGYRKGSANLIYNFSNGWYIGVPVLQWMGMTKEPKSKEQPGEHTYPKMIHWLRPEQ